MTSVYGRQDMKKNLFPFVRLRRKRGAWDQPTNLSKQVHSIPQKKKKKGAFEGLFVITPFLFFGERDVCVSVWKKGGEGRGQTPTLLFPQTTPYSSKKRFVRKLRWTSTAKKHSKQFSYLTVFLKLLSWQPSGWNWLVNVSKPPIDASFEISTKKGGRERVIVVLWNLNSGSALLRLPPAWKSRSSRAGGRARAF